MPHKKRFHRKKRPPIHPEIAKANPRSKNRSKADRERQARLKALDEHAASMSREQKARAADPFYDLNHNNSDQAAQKLTKDELRTRRCYAKQGKSSGWDNKPRRRFKPRG